MQILFFDIETAPEFPDYMKLPPMGQEAFKKRIKYKVGPDKDFSTYEGSYDEAPFYAEFSKVICIAVGSLVINKDDPAYDSKSEKPNMIYIKTLVGTETEIFTGLAAILEKLKPDALCAHNGKAFDYPFLCRRHLANQLPIPAILQIQGKKPWEITNLLDTMEMWRFGDMKYYVSLISLAYVFGVESPKDDMDGSMVAKAYYDGKIEDIRKYCAKDVHALVQVWLRMNYMAFIENVTIKHD